MESNYRQYQKKCKYYSCSERGEERCSHPKNCKYGVDGYCNVYCARMRRYFRIYEGVVLYKDGTRKYLNTNI